MEKKEPINYFQKAAMYDLLAQYYKYSNPELHMKYYKKHYKYSQLAVLTTENIQIPPFIRYQSIRFINLLSNRITLQLNGSDMLKIFPPKGVSEYFIVPNSTYQVNILPTDHFERLPKVDKLEVKDPQFSTFVITEDHNKIQILPFSSEPYLPENETKLRIIHLAHDLPAIDVRVKHGDTIFPNIRFGEASSYLGLSPMTIDFNLSDTLNKNLVYTKPKVQLLANKIYSLFIIRDSSKENSIKTLLVID